MTSDHGYTGPGRPAPEVYGGDLPRASAADHARTLAATHHRGMLATLAVDPPGYPFGSVASYVLDDEGSPLMVISDLAEHTRNATADSRASLLVTEAVPEGADPLALGRVTLIGNLSRVPDQQQDTAKSTVVTGVTEVGRYAHYTDFSAWGLAVKALRWVGGFGRMDWIDADTYVAAVTDPVIPHTAAIIEHMNGDHAEAGLLLCRQASGRSDLAQATMTAVDRFGCDYRASAPEAAPAVIRLAFPEPATGTDDVRRHLVEAVRAIRAQQTSA